MQYRCIPNGLSGIFRNPVVQEIHIQLANLPALITVIADLNKPRYPSVRGIVEAYREKEVKVWTAEDICADPTCIGLDGSPTEVKKTFAPEPKGEGEVLEGGTTEVCQQLVAKLKDKNVLR